MSEYLSINPLREEFINSDEDYRYAYAEDFLNTYIATQIKVLRDERKMTQAELAEAIGTKQSGVSRLESVHYSNWKTDTLKKIARALGVRLKITFETFGTLIDEDSTFSRETLKRPPFKEDPAFKDEAVVEEPQALETLPAANTFKVIAGASNTTPRQPWLMFVHEVKNHDVLSSGRSLNAQSRAHMEAKIKDNTRPQSERDSLDQTLQLDETQAQLQTLTQQKRRRYGNSGG